ncbi:MAG: CRISPR-associated protein Cas4 [Proteobacteria bacterium]|nr:CRISPR-associated protein Cas4 [Pseudomonadota bacterium]
MFSEDELLPISALQHLLFCERQAALIHIERLWAENRLTVEGRHLHEKTHGGNAGPRGGGLIEVRRGVRIARGMRLRSFHLGLWGIADVVEMHTRDKNGDPLDPPRPFPVEYKRGRPKRGDFDRVQLCAQALCLEEMLGVKVSDGAIFYARTRRRESIVLNAALRKQTAQTAARLHDLIAASVTPTARREKKCDRCSLLHLCMPEVTSGRSAAAYLRRSLNAAVSTTASTLADGAPPEESPP